MNQEERLLLENELLMTCSKAQAIDKYIDELEENSKLSELWCKSQQENQQLKEDLHQASISIQEMVEMDIMCPTNCDKLITYKSVLDEIKEYIKELDDNTDDTTCYDIDKNVRDDLLQILDKVKGEIKNDVKP